MPRQSEALFVALAVLHGTVLLALPASPLIAIGIWWNSNTIAHNFIHRPFFRQRSSNLTFSAYQSVLMGIPQALWRERHLAHHAGMPWRARWSTQLGAETLMVAVAWATMAVVAPSFFGQVYLPGYVGGLLLCALQGHLEHAGHVTTSHYGRLYNLLCFNDGYHVEHHRAPGVPWFELPRRTESGARVSRWPALLRWIDACNLDALEGVVLRSRTLQRYVVAAHRHAFQELLEDGGPIRRATIIGGGLFPRTALVLHALAPDAELVVVDANERHLAAARTFVEHCGEGLGRAVRFVHGAYTPSSSVGDTDLLVIPLAFDGDREAIYRHPPAPRVLIHDWLWRPRGQSRVVSAWLAKRLNLVRPA